jgi:hypothetical protein
MAVQTQQLGTIANYPKNLHQNILSGWFFKSQKRMLNYKEFISSD